LKKKQTSRRGIFPKFIFHIMLLASTAEVMMKLQLQKRGGKQQQPQNTVAKSSRR